MTRAIARDAIYRRRRFSAEIIELCVRWYITYRLSYRDLVAMMAERGIAVSHTTIMRWVLRYVPEYEQRWSRHARRTNSSWRVDETAICIRRRWNYLYRAVDRHGKSVHSLLCRDRGMEAAQSFFCDAVGSRSAGWPRKLNLDGNTASHRALRLLLEQQPRWRFVDVRSRRYLNNIVEQDHRAIKAALHSDVGVQVIPYRSHHSGGGGARALHSEAAVHAGRYPSAPRYVSERSLGPSACVRTGIDPQKRLGPYCTRTHRC